MVVRKTKKCSKYRGSKTHGCGSMKKRRGAGHRGGRGRAGSGKRGDGKKPSYWSEDADKGFSSQTKADTTMNVGHVSSMAASLATNGKATEKAGVYTLDMKTLNVTKLLGSGLVKSKLNLTVQVASAKAIEKVEKAGGKVTVVPAKDDNRSEHKAAKKAKREAKA